MSDELKKLDLSQPYARIGDQGDGGIYRQGEAVFDKTGKEVIARHRIILSKRSARYFVSEKMARYASENQYPMPAKYRVLQFEKRGWAIVDDTKTNH